MRVSTIALAGLRFASNRTYGGEGEINILAEDIKRNGLINPVTVVQTCEDSGEGEITVYEVIAGRRRVQAADKLGWKDIPCRILEEEEVERADEIAGSENINRLAMHPLDEAVIFAKLIENGVTIEELKKRYDRPASAIWQRVQLLSLTDGIKELFRTGKITLHAAAMLKSLDEAQQSAFYDKYQKQNTISEWDVRDFISKVRHDKLYQCMTGKKCIRCDKRTYFNDKTLFPELSGEDDLCLDHDCYMEKWQKLLSSKIKEDKAKSQTHAEAKLIVCDDNNLAKIFGKTITVDGTEFSVVKSNWENRPKDKPNKTSQPCFLLDIVNSDEGEGDAGTEVLSSTPMFWNEPAKKKEEPRKNPLVPIVKFLGVNAEEEKQTLAALTGKIDAKKEPWELNSKANEIERKVKGKVLDRILDVVAKKPDDEKDIDRFLDYFWNRGLNADAIKKFTGSEKITSIKKLSISRMFAVLYASILNEWSLPAFEKITPGLKNDIAEWAGIPMSQIKEMYLEELKLLVPKPEAGKKEQSKPQKKKAGR